MAHIGLHLGDERFISHLPLIHLTERMLIEQDSLRYGGHIFFAEPLDTFVQDLQRARSTIFFSVPPLWVKLQHGVQTKIPAKTLTQSLAWNLAAINAQLEPHDRRNA